MGTAYSRALPAFMTKTLTVKPGQDTPSVRSTRLLIFPRTGKFQNKKLKRKG